MMKTRRVALLAVVATLSVWVEVGGTTQTAPLRIDAERLMSTVITLADAKFEGRAAGSPGGIAAREFIVNRFQSIGVRQVAGAYVFPFTFARKTGTDQASGANVLGICVGK